MKISSLLLGTTMTFATLSPLVTTASHAVPFTSKKEGYSINLPGQIQSASRTMPIPGMGQTTVNFVSARQAPVAYVVIPIKLPAVPTGTNLNQFLDGVQRGFTMSTSAKLLSSKKISLQGAPGREILVQTGANLMRGRFYVKGKRSYQIVAISPKNGDAKYLPQVTKVLNSFRILN